MLPCVAEITALLACALAASTQRFDKPFTNIAPGIVPGEKATEIPDNGSRSTWSFKMGGPKDQ
jgi:hypothetical protein